MKISAQKYQVMEEDYVSLTWQVFGVVDFARGEYLEIYSPRTENLPKKKVSERSTVSSQARRLYGSITLRIIDVPIPSQLSFTSHDMSDSKFLLQS
jgi:hypothetical protein